MPRGFDLDDLTGDEGARTLTCPNGVTRPITKTRTVRSGIACAGCPLRDRCTAAAKGRSLHLHQHDALQREHRRRAEDPAWQASYRQYRPMVEPLIAWLVTGRDRRGPLPRHREAPCLAADPAPPR